MLNDKRIREIVAHDEENAEIIRGQRLNKLTLGIYGIRPPASKIISLKELLSNYLSSKKEPSGHQVIRSRKTILTSLKDLCINILQMLVPTSVGLTQNTYRSVLEFFPRRKSRIQNLGNQVQSIFYEIY
jgi:hypothetical protein